MASPPDGLVGVVGPAGPGWTELWRDVAREVALLGLHNGTGRGGDPSPRAPPVAGAMCRYLLSEMSSLSGGCVETAVASGATAILVGVALRGGEASPLGTAAPPVLVILGGETVEADLPLSLRRAVEATVQALPETHAPDILVIGAVRPCGPEAAPVEGVRVAAAEPVVALAASRSAPPRLLLRLRPDGGLCLGPLAEAVILPGAPRFGETGGATRPRPRRLAAVRREDRLADAAGESTADVVTVPTGAPEVRSPVLGAEVGTAPPVGEGARRIHTVAPRPPRRRLAGARLATTHGWLPTPLHGATRRPWP